MSTRTFRLTLAMFALLGALGQARLEAEPGDLVADFVTFAVIAPQDITYDETEDCFWITTFLDDVNSCSARHIFTNDVINAPGRINIRQR